MPGMHQQATGPDARLPPLQWDIFCNLLGGADLTRACECVRTQDWRVDHEPQLQPLTPRFSTPHQFLFDEGSEPRLLEVLWLKWNLFLSLCRTVQTFYQDHRRPHLGLQPEGILVRFDEASAAWLPVRWQFSVGLLHSGEACPFHHEDMPVEMAQFLFAPTPHSSSCYVAPTVKEWPLGREETVTLLIRSLDRIQDDLESEARGLLRVHVISNVISDASFHEKDVFQLSFSGVEKGSRPVRLWARKVDSVERGIVVTGATLPLSLSDWTRLERSKDQVISDANVKIYRAFPHSCDLYSLGILLLSALLVNESQTLEQVEPIIRKVLNRLDPAVGGVDPEDRETLCKRISFLLSEEGGGFEPSAMWFDGGHSQARQATIPGDLWVEALIFALRLLSDVPGFGFSNGFGGSGSPHVSDVMDSVVQTGEQLGNRIQKELFEARDRSLVISKVCDRIRRELVGVQSS